MSIMEQPVEQNTTVTTEPVQSASTEPTQTATVQPVTETVSTTPATPDNTQSTPQPTVVEYEIDGQKVTAEQIKEWRQGNMRLQDYTRKTQEVAAQRKENEKALEVYQYLQANPHIAQALANGQAVNTQGTPLANVNPANQKVDQLEADFAMLKLDNELERLKGKYADFDEVTVLKEADARGLTDLEFVYKALKQDAQPDIAALREQIAKEIRSQLTEEIRANGLQTQTIVSTNNAPVKAQHGLTPVEMAMADNLGVSYEDYAKNK